MRHNIVRRIETLAVELRRNDRHGAVQLVAHDTARDVLAGKLAPLEIERIAVAVVRRCAEDGDAAVVLDPAQLTIVRNVAPHKIFAFGTPRRALGPQSTGPQALNRRIGLAQTIERGLDCQNVGVGEVRCRRATRAEVARRLRDRGRRTNGRSL